MSLLDRRRFRQLALVVFVALASWIIAPVAQATFPGPDGTNGPIAYVGGDGQIWTATLTFPGYTHESLGLNGGEPRWSPDGQQIAYRATDSADGSSDIFVANADGTNAVNLTNLPGGMGGGFATNPAWSPDGQKVAYRGAGGIWVVNADGSGQSILNADQNAANPDWSPDGTRIAYDTPVATGGLGQSNREIFSMNADGTNPTNLSRYGSADDTDPSWSPNGDSIAFTSTRNFGNPDIWQMSADGTSQTNLTPDSPAFEEQPSWAPAGNNIAFRALRTESWDIFPLTGEAITSSPAQETNPDWGPGGPPPPVDPNVAVRPKGATPLKAALVPAFQNCAAANRTHGPPLAFPSCHPPALASQHVTVGTPDVNGAAANATGFVLFSVQVGAPGGADDADANITVRMSDVRCLAGTLTCGATNAAGGQDYTGQLEAVVQVRITDRTGPPVPGTEYLTMQDLDFKFTVPCTDSASTNEGGVCSVTTSFDATVPGSISEGKRSVFAFADGRSTQVFDGGSDGDVSTVDNDLFAVPGVFIP